MQCDAEKKCTALKRGALQTNRKGGLREIHLAEPSEQVSTMVSRASIATLFLATVLTSFVNAQVDQSLAAPDSAQSVIVALAGKVLGPDGRPLPGIHVELDEASTAIPISSTYTQPDGTFKLDNVPKGTYEVVADSGDSQVSNAIAVQMDRPSLELRFPRSPTADTDSVTSVARILVPAKARKIYRKAYDAFTEGKNDDAEKLLDEALQIEPRFAEALTLRGIISMQQQDLDDAQQYMEKALRVDPSYSPAYLELAAVYNHQGRYDDALRASERGLSLSPRSWQAYFEMAKASLEKGMYRRALQFARQAQRLGGNSFASLHLVKACALYPLKLYKDARYELRAVVARDAKGTNAEQAETLLAQIDAADVSTSAAIH